MNKLYVLLISVGMLLAACSGGKKIVRTAVVADGSSYDSAVVINEVHERQGIDAEYVWVRTNYPGSRVGMQSLNNYKNKAYDILHITTKEGKDKVIYFDISKFYGHF